MKPFLRRRFILVSFCIFILSVIIIIFIVSHVANKPATVGQSDSDADIRDKVTPLTITNLTDYTNDIDSTTQFNIITGVYQHINKSNIVAIVRSGSFSKSTDGDVTTIKFLVDINSLKQTYEVNIGRDTSTTESSLYVLCPSEIELIYPAFNCKDNIDA